MSEKSDIIYSVVCNGRGKWGLPGAKGIAVAYRGWESLAP